MYSLNVHIDDFRNKMVLYVISRMTGSNDLDLTCKPKPSKRFILGSLAPQKYLEDEKEKYYDDFTTEKASVKATMLRVTLLTPETSLKHIHEFRIQLTGNVYYKIKSLEVNEQAEEGSDTKETSNEFLNRQYLWKRKEFKFTLKLAISQDKKETNSAVDFSDFIKECNKDPEIQNIIPEDTWKADLTVKVDKYEGNFNRIHFFLTNLSVNNTNSDKNLEKTLFDCKLLIFLNGLQTSQFVDNYKYNGFKEKYFYDFRTINCQARFLNSSLRDTIVTEHYLRFEQENNQPVSSSPTLDLSFEHFINEGWEKTLNSIIKMMEDIRSSYDGQLSRQTEEFMSREGNRQAERGEFEATLKNFGLLYDHYKKGLEYLLEDNEAKLSFFATNKVFYEYYKNKLGAKYSSERASWRLFQIVFLTSAIRSIAGNVDFDVVDVLHVATGGGKSEAYFALIVFSMFYERIKGKKQGVSAIVKFPLRMLSIQQLERLASIIIYAEKVRKQNLDNFNGSSFTLGYYIGNSDDFPDLYSKIKKEIYEDPKMTVLKSNKPRSKVLIQCPLCPDGERGEIVLIDDPEHKRILHQCSKNLEHQFEIYYSDRELFRYRPTVIVSTVDKWAGLSQQRRARSLLGGNGSMCPNGHGFIPSGDRCEDKEEEVICNEIGQNRKDTSGPILSIQDEMHLLKESFGTISSHFEGLIERLVMENSGGRGLKHIAMSATLNGTEDQIRELYNKNSFVISGDSRSFPNPSFQLFFRREDTSKRIIVGMKPNMRDNHYATLRTILHLIEFLDKEQKDFLSSPEKFLLRYDLKSKEDAIQIFKDFLTPLTYHLKKQDAEDMFRFTDAVINDALKKTARVNGIVLTGDSGIDELKQTIDLVRKKASDYSLEEQIGNQGVYKPIFATSVVSHGVDLEELNVMIFQGIPYTTSEYIQALSRVGRLRQGIVFVWLYPNRVRDDSFYKNFKRYHESLDHEVMPIPIQRNSRLGVKQTLNSIFCAGIIQYLSNRRGVPLIHKKDIASLTDEEVSSLIYFIKSSYGTVIDLNIELETEERLRQVKQSRDRENEYFPNILSNTMDYFYRNQSGMRGIQENLTLIPNQKTRYILKELNGGV